MTHDEKQALLDQLALDRALIEADIAERERREAMGEASYWQAPVVTKDARDAGLVYKRNDDSQVEALITLKQLDDVIDMIATESGISLRTVKRALEDQIAALEDRIAALEDRISELEAERAADD
jgi:hypothetical protein